MEYRWWNHGYNYWNAPDSVEDSVPMSACDIEDVTQVMPWLYAALEHWDKCGSFDFSMFPPEQSSSAAVMHIQEHYEIDDSLDLIVPIPIQSSPREAPQSVNTLMEERSELRVELETFKRHGDSKIGSTPKRDPLKEMLYENMELGEGQMNLVDILEGIHPCDSDSCEELEEALVVVTSSHDHESLHEENVDENVQILDEKNGEVDPNMKGDDLASSPIVDEMGKVELESVCLEFPIYYVEFEEAPIIELPGYILDFEEAILIDFPGYIVKFEEA